MQYPECETCFRYVNNECTLDHPCVYGIMGLSDYEPKPEQLTLNELIFRLQQLQQVGYGRKKVTANMEYKVLGAGFDNRNDVIDIDCFC